MARIFGFLNSHPVSPYTPRLYRVIAIALLIATNVAFAQSKHVGDMAAIDAAMQTAKLTPAQRSEVLKYRG